MRLKFRDIPKCSRGVFVGMLLSLAGGELYAAGNWEEQLEGSAEDCYSEAQFRLWLPDQPISAVLCVVLGSQMNGLALADDRGWQALARRLGTGLLTVHFGANDRGNWDEAEKGSGAALCRALDDLAQKSGNQTIAALPLVLVGLSQGGQFGYHFAVWRPDRVRAFITLKGGRHHEELQPALLRIPALWVTAKDDMPFRQENIRRVYDLYHRQGAPWTLACEPVGGHAGEVASRLIAPYLEMATTVPMSPSSHGFAAAVHAFEAGEGMADFPPMNLRSSPLSLYARSEAELNFLPSDAGRMSEPLDVDVQHIEGAPAWDRVELADPDGIWEVMDKSSQKEVTRFRLRQKLPARLHIGLFRTLAKFRFYQGERLLMGGLDIPAVIPITGDVEASPHTLYWKGYLPSKSKKEILMLRSRTGHSLQWLCNGSVIPPGIHVDAVPQADGSLILTCQTDGAAVDDLRGMLLIRVLGEREWIVQVLSMPLDAPSK